MKKFIALALITAFAVSLPLAANAAAAPVTAQSVAQKIQGLAKPDIDYAIKLATAAGTVQSKIRLQCYQALQDALPSAPAGVALPPSPHLVTTVEQLAELIDALQPTSPLFVNCAGAAQLAGLSVLGFINAVVSGAASAAVIAPKL